MMLIAGLLLNAPALAAALGAEGGPGAPPVGDSSRGPGTAEGAAGARFDGALSAVINFPFSGGVDESLRVVLPEKCLVLNATLQLDGQSALPPAKDRKCTFADVEANRAYDGVSEDCPPTGGPATFQSNQFSGASYSDISRQDGAYYETMTWGFGSPYHLFKFKVTEDVVSSLTVKYVGLGYDWLFLSTEVQLYIYNSGHWSNIGGHSAMGIESDMVTIKKTLQSPAGCIDAGGMVNILAMGPDGWIFSFLDTDYIELTVKGSDYAWPSNLSLDLGADGLAELESPGELRGSAVIGSELLKDPLQAFVDAICEEGGSVEVPFRFSSDTGGVLTARGLVEIDLPPVFSPIPPEKLRFDEDTTAYALIDLDSYCQDDRDLRPRYEIFLKPPDGKLECALNASGHHLDFRTTAVNWSGTREFGLRATDRSGLSADTFFNVTVAPVNDPPVLLPVADQTAWEDEPFTLMLRAFDVDDPAENLTFSDDFALADIDAKTGVISFTPTNDQVGRYPVNVTVQDASGAVASIFFWLSVENVNDPPILLCDEELFAIEDQPFEYKPYAEDIDAGENLTFALESDIRDLEADPGTGLIEFIFENEHVGEHELELSVTDSAGAVDIRDILLTVENVNDPPVLEQDAQLWAIEDEEFEYQINATDVDRGDSLAYSIDSDLLELDERTGILNFTPGDGHVGRHKLTVTVTDRSGASAQARYILTVENVNDPPSRLAIVSPRANAELREGEMVLLSATAFDPDIGDILAYTWKEGEIILGRGANLSASLRPGKHLVTLEVSDGTVNETAEVQFTVLEAKTVGWGMFGTLAASAFPLALVLAAIVAVVLVTRGKGKRRDGTQNRQLPPPGPPFQPVHPPHFQPPDQPPAPQSAPAAIYQPPPYQPVSQYGNAPGQQGLYPPGPQQMAPGPWQPPAPYQYPQPPFQQSQYRSQPTPPFSAPPATEGRLGPERPAGRLGSERAEARLSPEDQRVFTGPEDRPAVLSGTEDLSQSYASSVAPAGGVGNSARPANGPPAGRAAETEPPFAIPVNEGPVAASTGAARPDGPPPPERHPGPDEWPGGPDPDGDEEPPVPRPQNGRRRRGDEGVVSRKAMRTAINDAKHAISAARAAGLNPSNCDRLLSEAASASYRLDYVRARNLARRAESVALSLLERAAREEQEELDAIRGADDEPAEEEAEEAA